MANPPNNTNLQEPLNTFRLGVFEPEDLSDNAPLKLYHLCAKYIITNINVISFSRKIPSEVCDNLIEIFRLIGSKSMCSRFLSEIDSKRCRVTNANLSSFEIKNKELIDFVDSHSKTLKLLSIANCSRLSKDVLSKTVETLIQVKDPFKLHRQVTCYEVDASESDISPIDLQLRGTPFLWRKTYHKQRMTTVYSSAYRKQQQTKRRSSSPNSKKSNDSTVNLSRKQSSSDEESSSSSQSTVTYKYFPKPLLTDYQLHQAMGLFNDIDFCEQYTSLQVYYCGSDGFIHHLPPSNTDPELLTKEEAEMLDMKSSLLEIYRSGTDRLPEEEESVEELNDDEEIAELDEAAMLGTSQSAANVNNTSPTSTSSTCGVAGGSGGSGAIGRSNWPQLNRQQQLVPPKRLNAINLPYRRITRSSSSAGHSTRPSWLVHRSSLNSGGSTSSNGQTNGSDGDVHMMDHETGGQDNQMGDDENEDENIVLCNGASGGTASQATANDNQRDSRQLRQGTITDEAAARILHDMVTSHQVAAASATSSSCPSLDSSIYFAVTPGPSGLAVQSHPLYGLSMHNNNVIRLNRANSQIAYNTYRPPHQCTSSSSTSNHPARSTTSQSHHPHHRTGNRTGHEWPTTSSSSTSSPPSPASLFPNVDLATSLISASVDSPLINFMRPKFLPYDVMRFRNAEKKKVRIMEIRTWEESPIESLILGKSANPEPESFTSNQMTELLFHPQLNNLKRLVIHEWTTMDVTSYIHPNLEPIVTGRLQHLDLSYCASIGDGKRLTKLKNLRSLILFNCPKVYKALDSICELKTLRVLDISTANDHISHQYQEPNYQLKKIIDNLPNLVSLDISGTNLAGLRSDLITGLEARKNDPLEFLGIFLTSIEASYRQNIPAIRIAGDTYENLILTSCEAYIDRVEMLRKCLNELFQLFRYESRQHDLERSLKILVCALGRHPGDKLVQVAASATLFYIVKSEDAKPLLGRRIKELIVSRLLDAMQAFRYDQTMLRNGCLNLIHFRIPSDVISEYTRLADILLYIVTNDDDDFVQRLGIYLLNSLACQVDGEQKTIVGNLGAIEKMLQLIEIRFNRSVCDEVMETAWSTMWNVTDETPINCERFLNNNGMEFFVSCMDKFSDCPELLRNMMGLLGNVSECAHLRYRLMKQDYISRFIILLASQSDGIEVSYNSAGILAHIASDGPEIWNRHLEVSKCSRDEMLNKMESAISRWEINSKRNINYRSFEPILRLLRVLSISWQAQYWAVWALANLTRVHCSKYCSLLEKDGGVEVLKCFVTAQRPDNFQLPTSVKCLAVVTLFQYYLYKEYANLKGLEKSGEIQCFHLVRPRIVINFLAQFDFMHLASEFGIDLTVDEDKYQLEDNNNEEEDICDFGYDEVDMIDGAGQQANDEDMLY